LLVDHARVWSASTRPGAPLFGARRRFEAKCRLLKPGSFIITTTSSLAHLDNCGRYEILETGTLKEDWGNASLYIQRRTKRGADDDAAAEGAAAEDGTTPAPAGAFPGAASDVTSEVVGAVAEEALNPLVEERGGL